MKRLKGVVAAGHPVTAGAAAEILEEGGNAFDAALAGAMTACVPEVVLAGLGGGGFLMARAAEGRTLLYDFFADTPRRKRPVAETGFHAIHADFGPARQEFHIGLGSSATPGLVPGLFTVHEDLCRLPMRRLAEPAVRAARDGVTMSDFHAYLFQVIAPILTASEGARALFAPHGALLAAGETFRNPAFADALEAIAREGPRLFTEGEIARAIVEQSNRLGGHLTTEDLAGYQVERRQPLAWRYDGRLVALNPAPAAGGPLLALGLGLLQRLPPGRERAAPVTLARLMTELNALRARLGPALGDLADAALLLDQIERAASHAPAPRGTTHVSVIDADGNAAAVSISNGEGNGHVVPGCGFMLNNMLGEEDLNPDGFHLWEPGRRLSSMMAPTVVADPQGGVTAMGSGGSNRIRSALLQVLVHLIDRGLALEEAVAAPRLHVEKCGTVSFEDCLPEAERAALLEAFPQAEAWPQPNMFFGGVHVARRSARGGLEGAGDPRRCGSVLIV